MTFTIETKKALVQELNSKKITNTTKNWSNYMGNVEQKCAVVVQIKNELQVQQLMKAVKKQNDLHPDTKITVRAAAGWADSEKTSCCTLWAKKQEQRYNESFSFSPGALGDVIVNFSPEFQKIGKLEEIKRKEPIESNDPLDHLKTYEISVPAGMQVAKLADELRKLNASMETVSMLSWASAIGLAGTGGHGSGRNKGPFSSQIVSFRICDAEGNIRDIDSSHEDFTKLCSAHSGALGIVLSVKLRVVEAFNLKETIQNYPNTKSMAPDLQKLLENNQYFSLIGIPSDTGNSLIEQDKWQIRLWNYTKEKPTDNSPPPYSADIRSWTQEVSVQIGDSVQDFLLDAKLTKLLPHYLSLAAAAITGSRGTKPVIGHENSITHYQVAFPKAMRDVSYILPVDDKNAGNVLAKVLQKIERLNEKTSTITYAVYVRYLHGLNVKSTDAGLATMSTNSDDEHILAIDIVTHPDAPGIDNFEKELLAYFKELGIKPRFHLGKNFPHGVKTYTDFLEPEAIASYKEALEKWYGGKEKLQASPFITPYFEEMLEKPKTVSSLAKQPEKISHNHDANECVKFLEKLIPTIENLKLENVCEKQKASFISECQKTLDSLRQEHKQEEEFKIAQL